MRSSLYSVVLLAALILLAGCDDIAKQFGYVPEKPVSSTQKKQQTNPSPTHRFALSSRDVDLAFDTQTGQLCRTWDWRPVAPAAKPTPEGEIPQRLPGELTPTCLSLYQQYPTSTDPSDPLGLRQDSNQGQNSN
jgi:hypothetical protein